MRTIIAATLLCLLAGCGDSGTTVNGTVKFSDGSPLTQGVVIFSNANNSFRGLISPDGSYKILEVLSGEYTVAITGTTMGGGTSESEDDLDMAYDDETGEYKNPQKEGEVEKPAANLIADKFADPKTSGVTISVPGDYAITVEGPG